MKASKLFLIPVAIAAGLVACTFIGDSTSAVARQDTVVPVPDDSIQPLSQLDRIESKLDRVLSNTEKTVSQLDGLKDANNANALMIVEAIKGSSACPDCPSDAVIPSGAPPKPDTVQKPATSSKVVVKYRSVSSPRWRINGKVWSRVEIINHLLHHDNHSGRFNRELLDSLSLGQLWALHDSDHDNQSLDVVPVQPPNPPTFSDPCPGGVCPPRNGGRRIRLFPNAWWNR